MILKLWGSVIVRGMLPSLPPSFGCSPGCMFHHVTPLVFYQTSGILLLSSQHANRPYRYLGTKSKTAINASTSNQQRKPSNALISLTGHHILNPIAHGTREKMLRIRLRRRRSRRRIYGRNKLLMVLVVPVPVGLRPGLGSGYSELMR